MAEAACKEPTPPAVERRWSSAIWLGALLFAVVFVGWDTLQMRRHYRDASETYGVAVRAPALDPASPTGYADGRRTVVYPGRWVDAQHWIMHTQQMLATGEWRLRHVDTENAPFGRANHWGSPFRWWIGLCGWLDHAITDFPLGAATERAALFANPALLCLLSLALVPWVARRFGSAAAGFLAVALVGVPPFYVQFAPDNMDHHGVIETCALLVVVGLMSAGGGWTSALEHGGRSVVCRQPSTPRSARRGILVAGLGAGLGMWVSAVGMIPVFVGVAVGVLLASRVGRGAPGVGYESTLWRRWGWVAGVTSLVCYLLEYFPDHIGWRLEVNHPLYALALVGAGEVLTHTTAMLSGSRTGLGGRQRVQFVLGLLTLVTPAVVIAAVGQPVFAVADPFLWSLSHDFVPEGQSLVTAIRTGGLNLNTLSACLPMLALLAATAWLIWSQADRSAKAIAVVPFMVALLFWLMAMKELRWWVVGYGFSFCVLVVIISQLEAKPAKRGVRLVWWAIIVALFAPGVVESLRTAATDNVLTADDLLSLAERDLAHGLRQRVGNGPLIVLSAPATTSRLIYFGGAKGLGTAYWENAEGMKRAAAIFAARSAAEAQQLVRAAGITHIVLLSWDDFVTPYVELARGLHPGDPLREPAFGIELERSKELPAWLRVVPDHLPQTPALRRQKVTILEVTDRTRPEQVLVRLVRDLLDRDDLPAAAAKVPELERYSDILACQIALARVRIATRDAARAGAAVERIEALSASRSDLETEDRIDLVTVLAIADPAQAAIELTNTLRLIDGSALRKLAPGELASLLELTKQLGVAWPDDRLHEFAGQLLPPDGRR